MGLISNLSKTDRRLLATGAGMYVGGKVTEKSSGGGPVGTVGSFSELGGKMALGYVGVGETVQAVAQGHRAFAGYHAKGIFDAIRGMGTRSPDMIQKDIAVAERIVKAGMRGIL